MTLFKFALKNLAKGGLRNLLNIVILAITISTIIGLQGLYDGFGYHLEKVRAESETGRVQYWDSDFDPLDPWTIENSYIQYSGIDTGIWTPILFVKANARSFTIVHDQPTR